VLTALMALGALAAFAWARGNWFGRRPHAAGGGRCLVGLLAFSAVIFAEPLQSATCSARVPCSSALAAALFRWAPSPMRWGWTCRVKAASTAWP
jgi:hypothetical protein